MEPEMIHGRYGVYHVLVNGEIIVDGGVISIIGVLPPPSQIVEQIRARLAITERDNPGQ
jgi:hypothetical protein